jgi:hypothetical protein
MDTPKSMEYNQPYFLEGKHESEQRGSLKSSKLKRSSWSRNKGTRSQKPHAVLVSIPVLAFPVTLLCAVMRVSQSAYYQFLRHGSGHVIDSDFCLLTKVRQNHKDSRENVTDPGGCLSSCGKLQGTPPDARCFAKFKLCAKMFHTLLMHRKETRSNIACILLSANSELSIL